jgi:hypothetical protein
VLKEAGVYRSRSDARLLAHQIAELKGVKKEVWNKGLIGAQVAHNKVNVSKAKRNQIIQSYKCNKYVLKYAAMECGFGVGVAKRILEEEGVYKKGGSIKKRKK